MRSHSVQQRHMLPRKIPLKPLAIRCAVWDSDSHRGYKLSSVPLSRLAPREQQETSHTPAFRHSVPHSSNQLSCPAHWLAAHLSVCFWSLVSVCMMTQKHWPVSFWSICLVPESLMTGTSSSCKSTKKLKQIWCKSKWMMWHYLKISCSFSIVCKTEVANSVLFMHLG